jgi:Tlde1 domain
MGFGITYRNECPLNDHRPLPPNTPWQRILGGIALICFAASSAWAVCTAYTGDDRIELAGDRSDKLEFTGTRGDRLAAGPGAQASSARTYRHVAFSVFDPRPSLGFPATRFAMNTPAARADAPPAESPLRIASLDVPESALKSLNESQDVNLPLPRPRSRPLPRPAASESVHHDEAVAEKPPEEPSFFQKLFGKPASFTLAYAAPDLSGLGAGSAIAASRYDQWTAVYDISARVVYMPDGTRLEAHSGLGSWLDDPSHVNERMRGATPPDVYDLELRESLFHGVRALRLIPEDQQKTMGRAGLLAHSFMLGPNGDSNGCVSFRNYDAFLQAYLAHKVKRLAVVARLD